MQEHDPQTPGIVRPHSPQIRCSAHAANIGNADCQTSDRPGGGSAGLRGQL